MNLFWIPSPLDRNYIPNLENSGWDKDRKWCENASYQLPSEFISILQARSPPSNPNRQDPIWKYVQIFSSSSLLCRHTRCVNPNVQSCSHLWSSWSVILSIRRDLAGGLSPQPPDINVDALKVKSAGCICNICQGWFYANLLWPPDLRFS